jgi:hypothetical protein
VVYVAASVEFDGPLDGYQPVNVIAVHRRLQLLLRRIQVVNVRRVMLLVVQFHDLPGDDRLQRRGGVG